MLSLCLAIISFVHLHDHRSLNAHYTVAIRMLSVLEQDVDTIDIDVKEDRLANLSRLLQRWHCVHEISRLRLDISI